MNTSCGRIRLLSRTILILLGILCALTPGEMLAQSAQVRNAQIQLNANGYDAGPADGFAGPKTRAAISAFQEANGLPNTGQLDERTQTLLLQEDADPEEPPTPKTHRGEKSASDLDSQETLPKAQPPVEPQRANKAVDETATSSVLKPNDTTREDRLTGDEPNTNSLLIGMAIFGLMILGAFMLLRFICRRIVRLIFRDRNRRFSPERSCEPVVVGKTVPWAKTNFASEEVAGSHPSIAAQPAHSESTLAISWNQQNLSSRPNQYIAQTQNGWIPKSGNARVAGRDIGGMVYVGKGPRSGRHGGAANAFIDPSKSVPRIGNDYEGQGMSYWPSYAAIEPRSRATYLDWLASGRCDRTYNVGYVFLYFYGLERRLLVDKTDASERAEIIAEVERLLDVFGFNHSIRRYLGAFLEAANILEDRPEDQPPVFEHTGYDVPISVLLAIGNMAARGEAVTSDWLLSWYMCHPETAPRTPAKRAFPEFRAYFGHLFERRFPGGMKLRVPKRRLELKYHAASGNFVVDLAKQIDAVPDISGFSKPLNIASALSDEASDALDKFSRYLGRNPEGRGTIEAHALLPEVIRPFFPCAEIEGLRQWVNERFADGGFVRVDNLITRLEGARPDKIGKRQLVGAADALATMGIGLAPDPRFALRRPKSGEPVVLFELPYGTTSIEHPSPAYQYALLDLAVGAMVAHADGTVDPEEEIYLQQQIEANAELQEAERVRLSANLAWMCAVPPNLRLLRSKLRGAPAEIQRALGQLAIVAAGADGRIDPEEVNLIESLYKIMGLDTSRILSDLHALTATDEPVTVRPANGASNEYTIPTAPAVEETFTLDASRISTVMQNTARVSHVLGNIFSDDDTDDHEEADDTENGNDAFAGLNGQHRPVVAILITREHWSQDDFSALAAEHQLMHSGALETINEWAFERFGDALIEEYNGFEINGNVAQQLLR